MVHSLRDTARVQTVSHALQTGGPEFNYTHQKQKFTKHSSIEKKQGILCVNYTVDIFIKLK